jgi:hypothetical protein
MMFVAAFVHVVIATLEIFEVERYAYRSWYVRQGIPKVKNSGRACVS